MNHPINEIVIRYERTADGYTELKALIDERGELVLDGADGGEAVRRTWGDWDYEYTETVPAERNTVLLHLVKERFTNTSNFRKRREDRGIPSQFWSWGWVETSRSA